MFFKLVAFAFALIPAALATITITGPTETNYWVQNTSNVITWTTTAGDPNPVSIVITNSNNTFLNGNFSIAEFVDITQKAFTVTNVTLIVADGYTVSFVTPGNNSQVLATSQTFPVKAPGTTPAPTASSGTPTSSSSGSSSTGSSVSGSSSGAPSPSGDASGNTSAGFRPTIGIFGAIAACGVASLAALLL